MQKALVITGCLGLVLSSCGDKRGVRAAIPTPVSASEEGIASWYGNPYHGRAAANGEIYDMEKFTAAHRTLPFGTWVRVYNLDTGKSDAEIAPYRYGPPASPHLAAALAGEKIDPEVLREAARAAGEGADALVCEGVGPVLGLKRPNKVPVGADVARRQRAGQWRRAAAVVQP